MSDSLALANAIEDAGIPRGGWAVKQGRGGARAGARHGAQPVRRSAGHG
jgi:hypothetical protein